MYEVSVLNFSSLPPSFPPSLSSPCRQAGRVPSKEALPFGVLGRWPGAQSDGVPWKTGAGGKQPHDQCQRQEKEAGVFTVHTLGLRFSEIQ